MDAGVVLQDDVRAEGCGGEGMIRILDPFHGAVLNHRHGTQSDDGLAISVRVEAELQDRLTVNGLPARQAGTEFHADVVLREEETDITAVAEGPRGRRTHTVRVVWDRHSRPRYRVSMDDNISFLRDIARRKYVSLFDCFYLDMLRELNRKYGTKFVLNVYYADDDDFNLTQFPDRYRGEWKDNAGWLRLAFHAYTQVPWRPYQYADPAKLAADFDLVADEIRRFAGSETYSPPTVIHAAMTRPSSLPVLYDRGVRVLSGMFRSHYNGDENYFLDPLRTDYLFRHDALKDFESGIIFSRVDIVCNATPLEETVPTLAPLKEDPNTAEVMDLFTHEQSFWKSCRNYLPDHAVRLDTAIRWVTEHGYEPVLFHEGYLMTA